jgi:hypothetical protein
MSDEERRTEEILDAAFGVFSARGYHNATVDDIAQEAGISKGTCYQYFNGQGGHLHRHHGEDPGKRCWPRRRRRPPRRTMPSCAWASRG